MICLSAGHHLKDPGASYGRYVERDLTIELRDLTADFLTEMGVSFILDKDFETLGQYLHRIRTGSGSVVLEFHFDAAGPTATGTTVYIPDGKRVPPCDGMARDIAEMGARVLGIRNRGVLPASKSARKKLAIMDESGIVNLVEVCFITNPADMAKYEAQKRRYAQETAMILNYWEQQYR
jgi:N-acetylmuramoyl-L-alanine amidase